MHLYFQRVTDIQELVPHDKIAEKYLLTKWP